MDNNPRVKSFIIGDMLFEYGEAKNEANIKKHGISFEIAARVFFDTNRIELYDEEHSIEEDRYDTIGSTIAGIASIRSAEPLPSEDIIFVVYTERIVLVDEADKNKSVEVTRLISARMATNFERGLYYGKRD